MNRSTSRPVLLAFTALLLGIFLFFPLMHELHHAHEEVGEPSNCPYHLLQISLLLFYIPLCLVVHDGWLTDACRCSWSIPLVRQLAGSPFQTRAPPRCRQAV